MSCTPGEGGSPGGPDMPLPSLRGGSVASLLTPRPQPSSARSARRASTSSFDDEMTGHFHASMQLEWEHVLKDTLQPAQPCQLLSAAGAPQWAQELCSVVLQSVARHGQATKESFSHLHSHLHDSQRRAAHGAPGTAVGRDTPHGAQDQLQKHLHRIEVLHQVGGTPAAVSAPILHWQDAVASRVHCWCVGHRTWRRSPRCRTRTTTCSWS
jgi:hypothetical protein